MRLFLALLALVPVSVVFLHVVNLLRGNTQYVTARPKMPYLQSFDERFNRMIG